MPLGNCDGAVAQSRTSRENAEFLTDQATEKFPQSVDRSSIFYAFERATRRVSAQRFCAPDNASKRPRGVVSPHFKETDRFTGFRFVAGLQELLKPVQMRGLA